MQVYIHYEFDTGKVFLNAVGSSPETSAKPFNDGSIEYEGDIDCAMAELLLTAQDDDPNLFPVFVPVDRKTGEPLVEAIGSSEVECEVNTEYLGRIPDDFLIQRGALRMLLTLENHVSGRLGL